MQDAVLLYPSDEPGVWTVVSNDDRRDCLGHVYELQPSGFLATTNDKHLQTATLTGAVTFLASETAGGSDERPPA